MGNKWGRRRGHSEPARNVARLRKVRRVRWRLFRVYRWLYDASPIHPYWWLRAIGWLAIAGVLWLVSPWLALLGPLVFELAIIAIGRHQLR